LTQLMSNDWSGLPGTLIAATHLVSVVVGAPGPVHCAAAETAVQSSKTARHTAAVKVGHARRQVASVDADEAGMPPFFPKEDRVESKRFIVPPQNSFFRVIFQGRIENADFVVGSAHYSVRLA